ncbi:MAG TPA: RDD family protein [Dokdonella sp.]
MPPSPAPLRLRLAAAIYDLFPLIALWMLTAALFLLVAHGRIDAAHPPFAYRLGLRAALLAVTTAYFVVSWSRGGQTIGMRAWRIRVVAADGGVLPWPRAVLRFALAPLALIVLCTGLGILSRAQRSIHDKLSGSMMIRISKT